jgi:outer membrane receptor for ferrienterochelin and colicins
VSISGRELLTDSSGTVAFRLAAGRYSARIERLGFGERRVPIEVRALRDTLIVVVMQEEALEEEEIVVTSTRGDRRIEDEPVKVEVVTREEVEEKLLMTPGNVSMLLNETSGIRVQETSPALGGANVRIQGMRGRYTQMLADGLPLYGGQAGGFGLLQIPPMDLRQVEIIKGAASALYGSSALGGVINLISRRPARNETELLLNATTRGGIDAVLWRADSIAARTGYSLLSGAHVQSGVDLDSDGWKDLAEYRRVVVRPRFFAGTAGGASLMATAGVTAETRTGGGSIPGGARFEQSLETSRADVGVSARMAGNRLGIVEMRASANRNSHAHTFGAIPENDVHSTIFAEVSVRRAAGAHSLIAGVAFQKDSYTSDEVPRFAYDYFTSSVFLQDEFAIGGRLSVAVSARADQHSKFGLLVSPRVAILSRPSDEIVVRLSGGRGFFAPTPFTEETEEVGLARLSAADALNEERATSFSFDVGRLKGHLETNVSFFASRIANAVRLLERDGGAELVNVAGITRTHGVETLARFRMEPATVTGSYTWMRATEPQESGAGRTALELTPEHAAGLVVVLEKHGEGRAGVEIYFTGVQALRDNPYRNRGAAFVLFGLMAEKRFGRVRAFINLENLGDTRQTHYHPAIRPSATPLGRWTVDTWAPIEGRTVNAGVRLNF